MRSVGFQPAEPIKIWVVSDGRAGIENQALGLGESIGRRAPVHLITKQVNLRTPWSWLPPGYLPGPRPALARDSDQLDPP